MDQGCGLSLLFEVVQLHLVRAIKADLRNNFCFFFNSLPKPIMTNGDLTRLINSEEIQSVLNPPG